MELNISQNNFNKFNKAFAQAIFLYFATPINMAKFMNVVSFHTDWYFTNIPVVKKCLNLYCLTKCLSITNMLKMFCPSLTLPWKKTPPIDFDQHLLTFCSSVSISSLEELKASWGAIGARSPCGLPLTVVPLDWGIFFGSSSSEERALSLISSSNFFLSFSSSSCPAEGWTGCRYTKTQLILKSNYKQPAYNFPWIKKKSHLACLCGFICTCSAGTVIFSSSRFRRLSMADILLLSSLIYIPKMKLVKGGLWDLYTLLFPMGK